MDMYKSRPPRRTTTSRTSRVDSNTVEILKIVGAVIGALLGVFILCALICVCVRYRRAKIRDEAGAICVRQLHSTSSNRTRPRDRRQGSRSARMGVGNLNTPTNEAPRAQPSSPLNPDDFPAPMHFPTHPIHLNSRERIQPTTSTASYEPANQTPAVDLYEDHLPSYSEAKNCISNEPPPSYHSLYINSQY